MPVYRRPGLFGLCVAASDYDCVGSWDIKVLDGFGQALGALFGRLTGCRDDGGHVAVESGRAG